MAGGRGRARRGWRGGRARRTATREVVVGLRDAPPSHRAGTGKLRPRATATGLLVRAGPGIVAPLCVMARRAARRACAADTGAGVCSRGRLAFRLRERPAPVRLGVRLGGVAALGRRDDLNRYVTGAVAGRAGRRRNARFGGVRCGGVGLHVSAVRGAGTRSRRPTAVRRSVRRWVGAVERRGEKGEEWREEEHLQRRRLALT